jgi:hypothetical protein
MYLFTKTSWSTLWILLALAALGAAIFFFVKAFILGKKDYEKQIQDRRTAIRNYLRVENDRYYHKRGLHWKPSKECSYLTLKNGYNP